MKYCEKRKVDSVSYFDQKRQDILQRIAEALEKIVEQISKGGRAMTDLEWWKENSIGLVRSDDDIPYINRISLKIRNGEAMEVYGCSSGYECPICGKKAEGKYCQYCGQKLDWTGAI